MSYYDTSPLPPQTYETVEAVTALLAADAELESALGGPGRIYSHRSPAEKPADAQKWRRLLVREPVVPGSREEGLSRLDYTPIQVVAEIEENERRHPEPQRWLSAVHNRVFELLVGEAPGVSLASVVLPIERRRRPSAPAYDADDGCYYSAAEYRILLGPVTA